MQENPAADSALPPGLPRGRLIGILAVVSGLGPMAIDMYLPSLPALQKHFASDAATAQLTLAAYFIGLATGQLFYGAIVDALGRKKPLLFGLSIFTLASAGCLFAPNMETLVVLRALQALGGCAGIVVTRAIVRDCFGVESMARVLSLMLLIMGIAPILAPLLGGYLHEWFGWQAIFAVLVGYGLVCMMLIIFGIPETFRGPRARPSFAASLASYHKLIRHRRFMGYALAGGIGQAGMFAYISSSSFVFIGIYGLSPQHYAWIFGLNACGLIVASQLNSKVLERVPVQRVLRRALRSYFIFGVLLLGAALLDLGVIGLVIPLFFCIASLGFSFPNSTAAAMAPFGDRAGSAAALLGTLQFTIASIASFTVGHLYNGTPVPMAAVITTCAALALTLLHVLAGPPGAARSPGKTV